MNLLIKHTFDVNGPDDWFDVRDPRIKEFDKTDDEGIVKKLWFFPGEEPARNKRRDVKITDDTVRKIVLVGIHHGAESPQRQVRNSSDLMPRVAFTLELWGAGYLIPRSIPDNPNTFAHELYADRSHGDAIFF